MIRLQHLKQLIMSSLQNNAAKNFQNIFEFSRTKIVPQGSMLGPILFDLYLNNLFHFLDCNICTFPNDTTLYVRDKNLYFVLE